MQNFSAISIIYQLISKYSITVIYYVLTEYGTNDNWKPNC